MPSLPFPACVAVILALAAAPPARAETWRLDPVHTRVAFSVDHAGLSQAIGTFAGVRGRLDFDPDRPTAARVELTVPLATLELGDAKWRDAVLDGTFLDAGDHPDAHFVSTGIETVDADRLRIAGTLTLRGVAQPVVLDATLNAVKRHPLTRRRSVGFSATATLSRRAFGLDAWPNVIGDAVELLIEVEAVVDPRAAPLPSPSPSPPGPDAAAPAPEPADDAAAP